MCGGWHWKNWHTNCRFSLSSPSSPDKKRWIEQRDWFMIYWYTFKSFSLSITRSFLFNQSSNQSIASKSNIRQPHIHRLFQSLSLQLTFLHTLLSLVLPPPFTRTPAIAQFSFWKFCKVIIIPRAQPSFPPTLLPPSFPPFLLPFSLPLTLITLSSPRRAHCSLNPWPN